MSIRVLGGSLLVLVTTKTHYLVCYEWNVTPV